MSTVPTTTQPAQCEAAHPDDARPCEGRPDAVAVLDRHGGHAQGCVRHAAVLLASLDGGRVYPASVPGAAAQVFNRAARLRPFATR